MKSNQNQSPILQQNQPRYQRLNDSQHFSEASQKNSFNNMQQPVPRQNYMYPNPNPNSQLQNQVPPQFYPQSNQIQQQFIPQYYPQVNQNQQVQKNYPQSTQIQQPVIPQVNQNQQPVQQQNYPQPQIQQQQNQNQNYQANLDPNFVYLNPENANQQLNYIPPENNPNFYKNLIQTFSFIIIIDCLFFMVLCSYYLDKIYAVMLIFMMIQSIAFGFYLTMTCAGKKFVKEDLQKIRNIEMGFIVGYFAVAAILTVFEYLLNYDNYFFQDSFGFCIGTVAFIVPQFILFMKTKPKSGHQNMMLIQPVQYQGQAQQPVMI